MVCTGAVLISAQAMAGMPTDRPTPMNQFSDRDKLALGTTLLGTDWRLVEFQSMDDATGTIRPTDRTLYTMRLNRDGTVTMRLDCNRTKGKWSSTPASDGTSGRFEFGPLASTKALCPPPRLDEKVVADTQYIRNYLLKDGRLYLTLMADGGIYVWEPNTTKAAAETNYVSPEDGGPRNWEVTGVASVLNLREQPTIKSSVIGTYTAGTILTNLGCQPAEGRTWCDVQQLGGGTRGYVAAEYLKPVVSPDSSCGNRSR